MKKWNKLLAASMVFLISFTILIVIIVESYRDYFITSAKSEVTATTESEIGTMVPDLVNFVEVVSNNCYLEDKVDCTVECSNINDVDIFSEFSEVNLSVGMHTRCPVFT